MDGTLVVNEKRGVVEKFKSWYKEKVIDTNKSAKFEDIFSKTVEFKKGYSKFAEKVGTVVVSFIPEVRFLAPIIPVICKAERSLLDAGEKAVISGKRTLESTFIGKEGKCEKVVVPEINMDELGTNIADAIYGIKDTVANSESVGKSK